MFYKSLVLIVVSAGSAIAQTLLTVQTPASLIQCEPALLAWSGGQGPYFIAAIPGGQSAAAALMNFGQHNGTSLTWTVNVTAGTSVSLKITDATGATNYDQAVTVQAGSDTSCLADDSLSANDSSMAATSSATSAAEAVTSSTSAGAAGVDAAATSITSAASSITSAVSSETATVANAVTSAKSSVSAAISSASSKAVSATSPAASASSSSHSGAMPVFDVSAGLLAVGISAMGLAWL